jgi:hypothetical protein
MFGGCEDGPMTLQDWVGSWEDVSMNAAQQRAVDALAQTLERLQPRAVDRTASSVSVLVDDEDEVDSLGEAVSVTLRHVTEPEWAVQADVWPDQAVIHWLGQTENTRDHCGDAPDAEWPTYTADVVADILSGYRMVENTYWRGRWRRTRWFDVRDPAKPERLSTEVGLALWWLFMTLPGSRVERQRLDFGVQARH